MNKKRGILLGALVVVLAVGGFFFLRPSISDGEDITHLDIKGKDMNGETVTSEVLKENELTMVNLWGVGCTPCIDEMPELEELSKELKEEGIGLMGVVLDGAYEDNLDMAKKILSDNKVSFKNIVPDEEMFNGSLENISAMPTTIFVDSEGNVVGEPVLGTVGKEEFKKAALENLEKLRQANDK